MNQSNQHGAITGWDLIAKVGYFNAKNLDRMLTHHAVPDDWKIGIINGMWNRSSTGFTHLELREAISEYEQHAPLEEIAVISVSGIPFN